MGRSSGARLIGRDAEFGRLRAAVDGVRAADRCVVLVSGEAGIGKTRLLAALRESFREHPADRSAVVIEAGCVDVGTTLSFLPVIELLDAVRRLDPTLALEAESLSRILGGTDVVPADGFADAPVGRVATFLRVRDLLARAAADRDVVAVIDDLHWADRSTLDVVAFLARRLVGTGVSLVLAYRSDELTRRHPLKPLIGDLERHAALEHLRLEPLSPEAVRAQVIELAGGEPDRVTLENVINLADGNPFHVEQLVSLDQTGRLPASLREVLGARLDTLSEEGRRLVDRAAVIGRQVDGELLATISDGARGQVAASVREAIEAGIMTRAEDGRRYAFRHALLREAVYDDLSPLDRGEAHRRIAVALTDHPELGGSSPTVALAERARHWLASGAREEAFAALVEAGRSAAAATAWAEALDAYESALGLWDVVEDPEGLAGLPRSRLLEHAAEVAWYEGDARRAVGFNQRAQRERDVVADPSRLGRLAFREANLLDDLGDLAGSGAAARRAVSVTPEDPPSVDRVTAFHSLGVHALRQGRTREAQRAFQDAFDIADRIGAVNEGTASLAFLAVAMVELGHAEEARATVLEVEAAIPQLTEQVTWSVATTWAPWVWIGLGDYRRAIEAVDRLLVDARARGLDRSVVGLWCLAPRALAELWLGSWDEALATIALQSEYTPGIDAAVYLRSIAARIAAGRGDTARARPLATEAIEIARSGLPEQVMVARLAAAWVELLDERPAAALDHIRTAWVIAESWDGLIIRSELAWLGTWAAADVVAQPGGRGNPAELEAARAFGSRLADLARTMLRTASRAADRGQRAASWEFLELASAEGARLDGADQPDTWATLAAAFDRRGAPLRTALSRLREAEAILRDHGDRDAATDALRAALDRADSMDARRVRERAVALGRAARLLGDEISIAPSPEAPRELEPWGLSTREREVLAMLARGATNRQIGDALFISDKTASVHVTHILDKLGVSRRTEAAILALRAGLAGDPEIREAAAAE